MLNLIHIFKVSAILFMILSLKLFFLRVFFPVFSVYQLFLYFMCQSSYFTVGDSAHDWALTMSGHDFYYQKNLSQKIKNIFQNTSFICNTYYLTTTWEHFSETQFEWYYLINIWKSNHVKEKIRSISRQEISSTYDKG